MIEAYKSDKRKIFLDISSLITYIKNIDRYSGIQRVVAEMLSEISHIVDPELLYVCWVDAKSQNYLSMKFSEIGLETFSSPLSMRNVFFPQLSNLTDLAPISRYKTKPAKYFYHRTRLDLMSIMGRDKSFRRWRMTAKEWRKLRRQPEPKVTTKTLTMGSNFFSVAQKDDNLLLLDCTWLPQQIEAFNRAGQFGLNIYTLIYDLIPLKAPHFASIDVGQTFFEWLFESACYTKKYLSISKAAQQEAMDFFSAHGIKKEVVAVPLVQSGLSSAIREDQISQKSQGLERLNLEAYPIWKSCSILTPQILHIAASPYVLCVGTIDSRKNIWRTAMAWKYLIDQGHVDLPQLVFAGRLGHLRDQLMTLLNATGNIYGYVHIVDGPSDDQLHFLYQNCQYALMTSLYEGWGLPVGEALAYGKTAVVADNSSLPEVGGDLVEYCDAQSVRSIADAAMRLNNPARRSELENRIKATKLRQWSDVARDILAAI